MKQLPYRETNQIQIFQPAKDTAERERRRGPQHHKGEKKCFSVLFFFPLFSLCKTLCVLYVQNKRRYIFTQCITKQWNSFQQESNQTVAKDKLIKEKKIHHSILKGQIPPLAQKVSQAHISRRKKVYLGKFAYTLTFFLGICYQPVTQIRHQT